MYARFGTLMIPVLFALGLVAVGQAPTKSPSRSAPPV